MKLPMQLNEYQTNFSTGSSVTFAWRPHVMLSCPIVVTCSVGLAWCNGWIPDRIAKFAQYARHSSVEIRFLI